MEGLQRMWTISLVFLLSLTITEGSHPLIAREQLHEGDFANQISFIQEDAESPGRLLGLIDNQLVEISSHTIKTIKMLGDELSKPTSFIQQGQNVITTHPGSKCLCQFDIGSTLSTVTPTYYSGYCRLQYTTYDAVQRGEQSIKDARYSNPYHITSINNQPTELYVTDGGVIKKIDQEFNTVSIVYEDPDKKHIFYRLVASGNVIFVVSCTEIWLLTLKFERTDVLAFTSHSDSIQDSQYRPNNTASTCDFHRMTDEDLITSWYIDACAYSYLITNVVPITPSVLLAVRCDDKYQIGPECKETKLTLIDAEAGLMTDVCCKYSEKFCYCDKKFMPGYVIIMNHTVYITNEIQQTLGDLQPHFASFEIRDNCTDCGGESYCLETNTKTKTTSTVIETNTSSPSGWTQLEDKKIIYISIAALIAVIALIVSGILCVLKSLRYRKNRANIRTGPLPPTPYNDNQIYDFIGDEFYANILDLAHVSTNNRPPVLNQAWSIPGDIELQVIPSAGVSSAGQDIGVYASDTNSPIDVVSEVTV